jgi:HD-GYP domain-containing protein (c-di-GMP phosphodiesterase class II)
MKEKLKEIPLGARILAVADTLTSDRHIERHRASRPQK